jgi:ankyrin repeat protein
MSLFVKRRAGQGQPFPRRLRKKEQVQSLLASGHFVDEVDEYGFTACQAAVFYADKSVLEVLLKHGPDLAVKDRSGLTPLEYSLKFCSDDITIMLLNAGAPVEVDDLSMSVSANLCNAATRNFDVFHAITDQNCTLSDFYDKMLHMALHSTVNGFDFATLNKLVALGVDVNARNPSGSTPIQSVARHGCADWHVPLMRWFIEAGADLEVVDYRGFTPLHLVCETWFPTVVNVRLTMLLLAGGANVHAMSDDGDGQSQNACQIAADPYQKTKLLRRKMPIIYALLGAGASVDVPNEDGWTVRQTLADVGVHIEPVKIAAARDQIARLRLDFVRDRAMQVCVGLQSLRLDALQMCEILPHACGAMAPLIAFHQWWKIATTVKHFNASQFL